MGTPEAQKSCAHAMLPGYDSRQDCLCFTAAHGKGLDLDCKWKAEDDNTLLDDYNKCTAPSILAAMYTSGSFIIVYASAAVIGASVAMVVAHVFLASRRKIQQPALLA